jgi:hypothetical protein
MVTISWGFTATTSCGLGAPAKSCPACLERRLGQSANPMETPTVHPSSTTTLARYLLSGTRHAQVNIGMFVRCSDDWRSGQEMAAVVTTNHKYLVWSWPSRWCNNQLYWGGWCSSSAMAGIKWCYDSFNSIAISDLEGHCEDLYYIYNNSCREPATIRKRTKLCWR